MLHYVVSILFISTPTRHTNKEVSCYVMLGPRCISNLSFNITFKWNKNKLSTSGTCIPGSQEYQCLVHIQYRYFFHFGVCGLHRRGWSSLNLVDFPQRKQPGCNMVDFLDGGAERVPANIWFRYSSLGSSLEPRTNGA